MDFETRAIHEGQEPDPATGAITTPIYLTSTYVQDAVGENKGYDYSRVANPTRTALQECLASLESAEHGVAFASGSRRDDHDHAPDESGRPDGADRGRLRRRLPDDVTGLRAQGLRLRLPPRGRVRRPGLSSRRAHADRLDRDAVEPAAEHRRHQEGGRRGTCRGRNPRRRQHLCDALPATATGARRGHRRALDHQVPRRALGRHRRFRRDERPDDRRAARCSCRSRSAPFRGRWTAGSCCAASRRSPCGCASIATARMRSPAFSTGTRVSSRSSTRDCQDIRATRSPPNR